MGRSVLVSDRRKILQNNTDYIMSLHSRYRSTNIKKRGISWCEVRLNSQGVRLSKKIRRIGKLALDPDSKYLDPNPHLKKLDLDLNLEKLDLDVKSEKLYLDLISKFIKSIITQ